MPNTDPRVKPTERLRLTTTELVEFPLAPQQAVAVGDRFAAELDAPYQVTARPVRR